MTAPGDGDIFARLTGMSELSLAVRADHNLGCVLIDVAGLPGDWQCVLGSVQALELADRLYRANVDLERPNRPDQGGAGPLSSPF